MKILRVNMSNATTSLEDLAEDMKIVGGRALTAKILSQEVAPDIDPLGPDAKLVIACGPLAGTKAPSCGRFSVGAKSPLTRGIKEANVGGPIGQKMDRLGIRAIIVEGMASDDKYYMLKISKDGISLDSADQYKGMKNYDFVQAVFKEHDPKASVISIGVAGERKWKAAAITMTDKDGHSSRHAARGGVGAVMGSRGLKAIVINDEGAARPEIADKTAYQKVVKNWANLLKEDQTAQNMAKLGTPGVIGALNYLKSMPANNYSAEPLEGVENLAGDAIDKINKERGGKMDGCMPGCLIKCSVVYHDENKKHLTSSYEYETIALMGTNLGIVDPDVVAKLDFLSDDLGIDTIDVGAAMGVAASAGKMTLGDADSALALIDEIEKGTEFGAVLGNGVVETCKNLGVKRVPAFRGQAMPAHDARVTKPTGVTYATSTMGADHTAGLSYDDFGSKDGQIERSLKSQILNTLEDCFGYCELASPGDKTQTVTFIKDLINAKYGLGLTEDDLVQVAKDTLRAELKFNEGAEFYTAHEQEPDFIRTEPVGPQNSVFDVDASEIATLWDKLDGFKLS
ncbi:MAG: aldehyde ferredoxin oxidoreductase [Proteobacteria bacterium]|nr:aldehyde ferredoxin oxidoreductase [Pseudomonadota bacterium]